MFYSTKNPENKRVMVSTKILSSTTVLNFDLLRNVSRAANQHIGII